MQNESGNINQQRRSAVASQVGPEDDISSPGASTGSKPRCGLKKPAARFRKTLRIPVGVNGPDGYTVHYGAFNSAKVGEFIVKNPRYTAHGI